ncbi:hypothetical protein [Methylocystis hirsuta]|uniref:Uncharacterized protein n=1 Tax=Methylocystis hirsuta TaxID=369798 RepID=A0A3M9XM68_9HYPH|nr:hypothetical protein [Methylocystis hirsuta]RNJ49379.1 hypothetical protein D1O30_06965 [Methylocystis hirsuta]
MSKSHLNRLISTTRGALVRYRAQLPATVYASAASALALASQQAKAGDVSSAVATLETARGLLDSFAA